MKKVLLVLCFIPFVFSLLGCQTAQNNSETVTKYTTFLGASLGQSKAAVEQVLGTGTFFFTQDSGEVEIDYYTYSNGDKTVGFVSGEAHNITAWASGYSIEGVTIGASYTYVISLLGAPSSTDSSDVANFCYWEDTNITVWFNKSTDKAYAIGIEESS